MNEIQAGKWRKTRTMGKGKYVMYFGVLAWGLSLTLLFTAMEWFTQHTVTASWIYIRIAVMGIAGFFIANFRWDAREQRFHAFEAAAKAPGGGKQAKKKTS
ncbi:hypothetical protein N0M98_18900 [Paenibacillus doosanensis]|uniref:hypothetical protein n=1 Tax=Paenibacillus doosanensis TaxID=1229154 RepID=UPI00217F289A|nr:hypothetical protein [Paenibacillus doosanensis]MCS7462212.1 hypothetical protein [Paenibacillus doosanensis]